MSDTEITLVPGQDGDDAGNGWAPRLAVDHDGRHELYVIVGEEVGGMVENVPPEVFAALRNADCRAALEEARALIETAAQDGYVGLGWREDAGRWAECWKDQFHA